VLYEKSSGLSAGAIYFPKELKYVLLEMEGINLESFIELK
jgi:hypothetical protein